MIWLLRLNDMRFSKIETMRPVAYSHDRENLKAFLNKHSVEPYEETIPNAENGYPKTYKKCFEKGSPLEWFNPPFSEKESLIQVEEPAETLERITADFKRFTSELIQL